MAVIGRLDRRITIQEQTTTEDAYGSEVLSWDDLATVWAGVTQTGADEQYRSDSDVEQASRNARFRIRYRDDVDETMRIVYDGYNWDIEGIAEWGNRDTLQISARAVVA